MNETSTSERSGEQNFFQKNKEKLGLGALVVYVFILGLHLDGTFFSVHAT